MNILTGLATGSAFPLALEANDNSISWSAWVIALAAMVGVACHLAARYRNRRLAPAKVRKK